MASSKQLLKNNAKKTSKQQSAIEYVLSYSWAIIILIAILVVYFYYSNTQSTYTTSYCYISPEFPCYQVLINSNSLGSSAIIEFSNNVGKPLYFSSSSFAMKFSPNSQYYTGPCQPTTSLQGSRITCTVSATGLTIPIGSEVSPSFYLSYSECISQNCNSNNRQVVSLTTSGSGISYVYLYNSSSNNNNNQNIVTYTLTTNSLPTAGGSTNPTSGIYDSGNSVSVSETPNTGYSFNDWTCTGSGCYSGTSINPTIIMDSNIIETANFKQLATYTLTTSAVPSNGGSVSPSSGSYYSGTQVTISETPASGYVFTGWSCTGTGCYSGSTESSTITMNSDISETANFAQSVAVYSLTTNTVPTNGGTVSPVSGSYDAGNSITISETPASGYKFTDWSCSGAGCYSGTSTSNTIIISANTVETANYQKQTGYTYPVAAFSCLTNDTYLYGNNAGGQSIGLMSDKYHNNVLNSLGSSFYESNLNYLTVSRGGYIYSLSKFYNDGYNNFTTALVVINTSDESVVKEILIANATANTTISNGISYGSGYEMYFNASGSLYILFGIENTVGPYLVDITNTNIQNALSSPNLFYNINNVPVENLTNKVGSILTAQSSSSSIKGFAMLGNYAYISNSTNLFIINTSKSINTVANDTYIGKFGSLLGAGSGIINMVTNGNFVYFAVDNVTTTSSGYNYNTTIAVLNTTSFKIKYVNIVNSANNFTVGAALDSNLTRLYVVLSNETVYTLPVTSNGLGSITNTQNFKSTDPNSGSDSLPLASMSQYDLVSSANGTELYVTTVAGSNMYEIYNLKSGVQNGILGGENSLQGAANYYVNADITCSPQSNYNIYTTGAQKSGQFTNPASVNEGQISVISSAFLVNEENITLPSTFSPTALLYDGNILRIGGYNYTGNTINVGQALLTTANTINNIVNSNIIAPEAQMSYFYNSGYPMTPETSTYYLPMVADFSQPNGNFFSIYPSGTSNYDFYAQTLSQVFPTNDVISGMTATTSNSQAANCPSGGPCTAGSLYLTPYQTIDAFSSMYSTSGSVCAAQANYGFASTQNVYINGMLEKNNDMTVLSYQTQSQDEYTVDPSPAPGGMGATAAQIVFNYPLNDTIASTYNANGNSDTQTAAGTGDAGPFSCSSPPSPNEFITYSYWTVTDSGLLSQSTNSILTNPPLVPINNTQDIYMLSGANGEVAIYNTGTDTFSTISLPHFQLYDISYYNNRDAMAATTNGTFVFVDYATPFSNCAIATINTQLQKIVKINYNSGASDCVQGGGGEMITSPNGKYLYSGISSVSNAGAVYSIYDLTHYNSTFESGVGGNFNISFAQIGGFTLPIGNDYGYGVNSVGDNTYQRVAISTNTKPSP